MTVPSPSSSELHKKRKTYSSSIDVLPREERNIAIFNKSTLVAANQAVGGDNVLIRHTCIYQTLIHTFISSRGM